MNPEHVHDVIVVGAGPAGSACAGFLAGKGLDVLLIDRARFPREKICGDCLHPRSWTILRELNATEPVRNAPHRTIDGIRIVSWTGRSAHSPLKTAPGRELVSIARSILDDILARTAEKSGARFVQETQLLRVEPGDPLRVMTRGPHGEKSLRCRYLVGADGRNSAVAASVDHERHHRPDRVGLQWFTSFQPMLDRDILLAILPWGYFGVVNLEEGKANVAMALDPRRGPVSPERVTAALVETFRSNELLGDLTPRSEVLTTSPINPRTRASRHGRIFLAGDAERTVEPFTGEGIAFALESGRRVASQILALAKQTPLAPLPAPGSFRVNKIFSPVLRHPIIANIALAPIARSTRLFDLALRGMFR